jgi:hypothetical protein
MSGSWRPQSFKDSKKNRYFRVLQERVITSQYLEEDAANCPNISAERVKSLPEKDFWSDVVLLMICEAVCLIL